MGEISEAQRELSARRQAAQELMAEQGVDVLLVFGHQGYPSNVRYLADHEPSIGAASFLLWPDRPPTLLTTFVYDVPRAQRESGLNDVRYTHGGNASEVEVLREAGLRPDARIGVVGFNTMPHAAFARVAELYPQATWVDLRAPFERLRLHKNAYEVELLRKAAAITQAALAAVDAAGAAGVSEMELIAVADAEVRRLGAERWAFQPSVFSGPDTSVAIAFGTERRLEPGDLVVVDLGAVYRGYCADLTRTFVVGEPEPEKARLHQAVIAAYHLAVDMVRPGVPMRSIHQAAHAYLVEQGYPGLSHRVGHGVGLETSYEAPDLSRDEGLLDPGMVFCIEPGVYISGLGGARVEDTLVVTEDGCELFTDYPLELSELQW